MKTLANRPLSEVQAKTAELARDRIETVFPNWFVYQKHGDSFTRYATVRYVDNNANRYLGYCAAEKAVWIAANNNALPRDLLLVWQLTLIEHQFKNRLDAILSQCYIQLEQLNGWQNENAC